MLLFRYDDFGNSLKRNNEFAVPSSPMFNWLVLNSRSSKGNLSELLANRKKGNKGKSDVFLEALTDQDTLDVPVNVSIADVYAVNPLDSFSGGSLFYYYSCIIFSCLIFVFAFFYFILRGSDDRWSYFWSLQAHSDPTMQGGKRI